MKDHTFNGVPVAKMSTADILYCLADGIEVTDSEGLSDAAAEDAVRRRLQIELVARGICSTPA